MARNFPAEVVSVAIASVILFALIHMTMMQVSPEGSMTHPGIFAGVFLTGALFHMIFEYVGWNKKFCDYAYKTA